ncbi:PilN domain-containing protein [Desulfopila sp. IMCC35008]|uniref:PilN domain-containing protein n=1 Tax=Desulfopila sp. IMCC35008 TaxID=2653858 RepID=UPI0013CF6C33|nr:PilN domain-containing protein [Desulfopila sp. IMCC35008]
MLQINLLPVRQLKKRAKARYQIFSVLLLFLAFLAILGFIGFFQTQKVAALNETIAAIEKEKKSYQPILDKIKTIEAAKKELVRKTAVIDKLKADSSLTVRVLDEVANIIDNERMWLLTLNQQGGSLSLSGMALDNQTVAQFMDNLKLSPFITSVNLSNSSLKQVAGRDLKSFSLSCAVSQPAPVQNVAATQQ